MKQSIRIIAMLFTLFAVNFYLSSCNNRRNFNSKTGQKLVGPILITNYDTADSSLTLQDSTTGSNARDVIVSRTQLINWNPTSNASDVEIVEIAPDPAYQHNDPNFFSTPPHQVGASRHWQAIVGSPDPHNGLLIEKYYIKWKLKNGQTTYRFDPLLQLYP